MSNTITMKSSPKSILKQFKEAFDKTGKTVNLSFEGGFLYYTGGMLCKLQNNKQFFFDLDKNMWVKI